MTQRLTQNQLGKIVAEVELLSQRREAELDPEQVKEILQELNLPPDLLDEALVQLGRRQALQQQQRRNRWIFGSAIAVLVIAIALSIFFSQRQNSVIAGVSAQQNRITLAQDDGGNLKIIERQSNSELYYRVTLKDAPVGETLNLSCNWNDPNGQLVKQNNFQTREVTTSVWNTYCRYNIGSAAPTGNWKVQMLLNGRSLSDETFQVK
ncbi:MAG: DUF3859 domain-containing protein [Scytonematopsis contorta HA4267-MV1]|jgi:hypothetical protein|nr:DUF3859 domain-containing protein [Scytonematopsis contorta HA4267-MV1]